MVTSMMHPELAEPDRRHGSLGGGEVRRRGGTFPRATSSMNLTKIQKNVNVAKHRTLLNYLRTSTEEKVDALTF